MKLCAAHEGDRFRKVIALRSDVCLRHEIKATVLDAQHCGSFGRLYHSRRIGNQSCFQYLSELKIVIFRIEVGTCANVFIQCEKEENKYILKIGNNMGQERKWNEKKKGTKIPHPPISLTDRIKMGSRACRRLPLAPLPKNRNPQMTPSLSNPTSRLLSWLSIYVCPNSVTACFVA